MPKGLYKLPSPHFNFTSILKLFQNSLKSLSFHPNMALPRTPDLPAWDRVLPAMDALRSFGLAETEEIPLRVDSAGHIRGGVTGKVSTISPRFSLFSLQIGIGQS